MAAVGWVMPNPPLVGPGALNFPWLKSFDTALAFPIPLIKEHLKITPSVSIFNLFNFSNAFLAGNLPVAPLAPGANGFIAPNAIGGVTSRSLTPFRATFQSGTYALGAPRQFEFRLNIDF